MAELPDWVKELQKSNDIARDDDTDFKTQFLQRMLMSSLQLRLQAQNSESAVSELEKHLDRRSQDVARSETCLQEENRRLEQRLKALGARDEKTATQQ